MAEKDHFKKGGRNKKLLQATGVLIIITISVIAVFWGSQTKDSDEYAAVITELQASIPAQMAGHGIPGLSIALIDGTELVWAEGFGHTDRTKQHPVTSDTLFSLQSVSKAYTATGFLIAASKGLVHLDDPLMKYYPEFRVKSRFGDQEVEKITFRHLLSHWSGLPHEAPGGGNMDASEITFDDHIYNIAETWLKYPVGQRYSYSNLGYDLVGYALQRITQKSFSEYMTDEVFEPQGMATSTCDQRYVIDHSIYAKGHVGETEAPALLIPMIPAGGVFSSARETAKFVAFHLAGGVVNGNRLIAEELLQEMYTPQFPVTNQVGGMGLGTARIAPGGLELGETVLPTFNTTHLLHGGRGYGYQTVQWWLPEYQLGVVVLTNQANHPLVHYTIAHEALESMIRVKTGVFPEDPPLKFTENPIISLEPPKLQRLVGRYAEGGSISIRENNGDLWMNEVQLRAHSETEFTTPRGALITFHLDEGGAHEGLSVLSNGGYDYFPLDHTSDDPPGPGWADTKKKDEWEEFTGTYQGQVHGITDVSVSCYIMNGYLYITWPGNAKLTEYAENLFFTCEGEAIIFGENSLMVGNRPFTK